MFCIKRQLQDTLHRTGVKQSILDTRVAYFQMENDVATVTTHTLIEAKLLWLHDNVDLESLTTDLRHAVNSQAECPGVCLKHSTVRMTKLFGSIKDLSTLPTEILAHPSNALRLMPVALMSENLFTYQL
ncbi:unnamed protein product [Dicrocoelium dendriticum]|nr:unnamed protein product [Dicrocoelium dendriticum]